MFPGQSLGLKIVTPWIVLIFFFLTILFLDYNHFKLFLILIRKFSRQKKYGIVRTSGKGGGGIFGFPPPSAKIFRKYFPSKFWSFPMPGIVQKDMWYLRGK